jgi:lysophospholipase L1-like esterase
MRTSPVSRRPKKRVPGATRVVLVLAAAGLWLGAAVAGGPAALRIMPLGDSITEGRVGSATYRYWLEKDLERAHQSVDFVGSQHGVHGGRPRFDDFDQDHEGHWGWTTGQVLERIDEWAAAAHPDVVLLHLGTNDLVARPAIIPTNLAAIIQSLRKANPHVTVLVARLIPAVGVPAPSLERVNDSIEHMAAERSSAESSVVVVRQDDGFDARTDTYDGIHPNESGERKMAKRWLDALRALPHLR